MKMDNFWSDEFGKCRIIDEIEYVKNSTWHDVKQEDNYMIVTDDKGNYYASFNDDNHGADNFC